MIKTKKLPLITTLICLSMVFVLALTIGMTFNLQENDTASAAAVFISNYTSGDGYLYDLTMADIKNGNTVKAKIESENDGKYTLGSDNRFHMTAAGINAKYSTESYSIEYVSNATQLKAFIEKCNSESYANTVGVINADIDYNMQTLGMSSSTAAFFGILEGNAYTITITAPVGGSTLSYNGNYTNTAGNMSSDSNYKGYQYAGMICAVNRGMIMDCNIVWNSDYTPDTTIAASNLSLNSPANYEATSVGGIVCGLLYNGTIFNCNLTANGAFTVCHQATTSNTGMRNNSVMVGGYAGVMAENSRIERSTINNYGGITASAEGPSSGVSTKMAMTVSGGLVGAITKTTAYVKNCSLTGNGSVNARMAHSPKDRCNDGARGFAGGAIGASVYVSNNNAYSSVNTVDGQIDGIISAWYGARTNDWWEKGTYVIDRKVKSISGCLFDYLGDYPAIESIVVLYDYLGHVENNTKAGDTPYTTIDSGMKIGYGNWTEIFSTNAGGIVNVSYDYSKSIDPIRVETVANGFFDDGHYVGAGTIKDKVGTTTNFFMSDTNNNLGRFIWSCEYNELERGVYSGTNIWTSEQIGAQIFLLSAERKGAIKYTFGEVVSLNYKKDTNNAGNTVNFVPNNAKNYSGDAIKTPTLILKRSNDETATIYNDAYEMKIKYTIMDGFNETDYKYDVTDEARTYLPGLYTYTSKITINENGSNYDYGYYSSTSKVLANYDENNSYKYEILSDSEDLFVAECESSPTNYLASDTIKVGYKNDGTYTANIIDYYSYAIGSNTQGNLIPMGGNATSDITINTTGKYVYSFVAYLDNPYELEKAEADRNAEVLYLQVAKTTVQVYIDTEAPLIKNIHYYEYIPGEEVSNMVPLSTFDLQDWQTQKILVTYTVTDNNLSGLASGSGHTTKTEVGTTWECQLILDGTTSSKKVTYVDAVGNKVEKTFSLKIDTTQTKLDNVITLNYQEYLSYYAQLGACPVEVHISFKPIFGASGAYLEYAYELDEQGKEIWIKYDQEIKANIPNEFIVDFDINNSFLKMRLVSEQGVYETSYANGNGFVLNGADDPEEAKNWSVKIVIAYLGITLDNIFYGEKKLSEYTFRELFKKTYDASDVLELPLTVKIYSSGNTLMEKTSVVYSETYAFLAPDIIEANLAVRIVYDSSAAGDRIVRLYVDSIGELENSYRVYFTDGTVYVEGEEALLTANDKYYEGNAKIVKANLNINLADYEDQLNSEYVYGEEIPEFITIKGVADEDISLKLNTNAKLSYDENGVVTAYPSVGSYNVSAAFVVDEGNYNLNVTDRSISITKKAVSVKTKIDGEEDYSTKISFTGLPHNLTGTYVDVFGTSVDVVVKYYANEECTGTPIDISTTGGIKEIGTYYAKISIADANYSVYNTSSVIKFEITKVYIDLELADQYKQFTGEKISYEIIISGKYDSSLISAENFTIKYYKVINEVADLENPLEEVKLVGKYLVDIELEGNAYFYNKAYPDTYLYIEKAETIMDADEETVVYDGSQHLYDILTGNVSVTAKESKSAVVGKSDGKAVYFDLTTGTVTTVPLMEAGVFNIYYFDTATNKYILIDDINLGTFIKTGVYRYKLEFLGDANYAACTKVVQFTIVQATFEGVAFVDKQVNYEDPTTFFPLELDVSDGSALKTYLDMGAKLVYKYQEGSTVLEKEYGAPDYTPFEFNAVGTYIIMAELSLDNYQTLHISGKLTVLKTAMKGIRPVSQDPIVYDGAMHPALFACDNFDKDPSGKMKVAYYEGFEDYKLIKNVWYLGELVTVYYDDEASPTDAGEHIGTITFTSDTYADVVISTMVTITSQVVQVSLTQLENFIDKINSKTDITNLGGTYNTVDGSKGYCSFEYYDSTTGKKVELNEDGCLPAGTYRIVIKIDDGNYVSTQTIKTLLEVKEGTGETTTIGGGDEEQPGGQSGIMDIIMDNIMYIGIGAGVVVVIIIIAIAASASKKKKRKKRKKNNAKNRPNEKPSNKQSASAKKTASKDRATF